MLNLKGCLKQEEKMGKKRIACPSTRDGRERVNDCIFFCPSM